MKIAPEHFEELKGKIQDVMINRSFKYLLKHYIKEGFGKDPKRLLCFNIFYQTDTTWRNDFITRFYEYANDDHLYTALKRILT